MIGRSGSPSRNSMTTSCPMRGQKCAPQEAPAQGWNADPTGARLVVLAFAFPMELYPHTSEFIQPAFFTRFDGYDCRLWTADEGLGRQAARPNHGIRGNTLEAVLIWTPASFFARNVRGSLMHRVIHLSDDVFPVGTEVLGEGELVTACEIAPVGSGVYRLHKDLFFFHPDAHQLPAFITHLAKALVGILKAKGVFPGIVVELQGPGASEIFLHGFADFQRLVRKLEMMIAHRILAGTKLKVL